MRIAFAILFALFFFIASYPLAKNLQLSGYDCCYILRNYFSLPYEFRGKNRLVFTKRALRLIILYFLLLLTINFLIFLLIHEFWIIIIAVILQLLFLNGLLVLSALILQPLEKLIKNCYIKKAKKLLNSFKGTKVAITGSFGKSSTKNFLCQILQKRFKVCHTPKNYNTPMGLCKTAIELLKSDDEILVVEMGARRRGDIAELMGMLNPSYGIMTAVGEQHLESFGSLSAVENTKFEMCEHMCKGGCVVFDCASENTESLANRYRGEKKLVNIEGGFAYFTNLKMSSKGCKFKLHIAKKSVDIETKIIGRLLLNDLVAAASMAYLLGVEIELIADTIAQIKPFPHRLQIIETPYTTIIDDSYNSNLVGAGQALEALKLFKGKKIVITPGLIEQGQRQYELNYKLGKLISGVCDELIIMNKTNQTALTEGAKAGGIKDCQLHFAKTRQEQTEILQELQEKGSVVLFENDLPDHYN